MKNIDLLGIPDTSLRGLNTRTALSVRKSNCEPTVDRILKGKRQMHRNEHRESIFKLASLSKSVNLAVSPFLHFLIHAQTHARSLQTTGWALYVNPVRAELIDTADKWSKTEECIRVREGWAEWKVFLYQDERATRRRKRRKMGKWRGEGRNGIKEIKREWKTERLWLLIYCYMFDVSLLSKHILACATATIYSLIIKINAINSKCVCVCVYG